MPFATFKELLDFNRWGHDRILSAAAPLSDAQLDRPFEMGPGSLRATINHLYSAERIWLDRWKQITPVRARPDATGIPVAQLKKELTDLAAERDEFLRPMTDAEMTRLRTVTNLKGDKTDCTLHDMLLHVCNHAIHHRAQAVNMIKRVGGQPPTPGADYIFMRVERISEPPPDLDLDTIRAWLAYADWARAKIAAAAAPLSDAALDQPFEMGPGSLRKTLIHVTEAEAWWWGNWNNEPEPFPDWPPSTTLADLTRRADEIAAKRNKFVAGLTDADLKRTCRVVPRPGREFQMAIGVSLLQICCHGTHHRAQASNMLRHNGVTPPPIDYFVRVRENYLATK